MAVSDPQTSAHRFCCGPEKDRKLVEMTAMRRRLLQDTLHTAWITYRESQALIARSHGKLYLATDHGEKTIRD